MKSPITIPHGEETITIQLTVKQAMALTGLRFQGNPKLLADARRKVQSTLDRTLLPESEKIQYHHLGV